MSLTAETVRRWLRGKGIWVVLAAALLPPVFTGAWTYTHQNDLVPLEITYEPAAFEVGDNVTITAVVYNNWTRTVASSNLSLQIGFFQPGLGGPRLVERATETFRVPAMRAGQERSFQMEWTAEGGTHLFIATVDLDDEVKEIEENNNQRFVHVQVPFTIPDAAPVANASDRIQVTAPLLDPTSVFEDQEATISFSVRDGGFGTQNATASVSIERLGDFGYTPVDQENWEDISIEAGGEHALSYPWTPREVGVYRIQATIDVANETGVMTQEHARAIETVVDRELLYEGPEAKATAKAFYRIFLSDLNIRILIPLITLFFAAGTLSDEQRRGNLAYILTRPVARWALPVRRAALSFVFAGVPLAIGSIVTFAMLLALPQAAAGYLWFPLGLMLLAALGYIGLWTLLSVSVNRPVLWGAAYALGVETGIIWLRSQMVGGQPILQEWALRLSVSHWMTRALEGWDPVTSSWVGGGPPTALYVVIAMGVGGIASAAWWMTQREFPE